MTHMNIWNYIGEFFFFRWLFDKFRKVASKHDTHTEGLGTAIAPDRDCECQNDNHDGDIASIDGSSTLVGDNLLDDSDNSEDLDDLDIFMRNNNSDNRSCQHHGGYDCDDYGTSRYSGHQDWNSGYYSQSYDDFLDEQDDYDMMDNDF